MVLVWFLRFWCLFFRSLILGITGTVCGSGSMNISQKYYVITSGSSCSSKTTVRGTPRQDKSSFPIRTLSRVDGARDARRARQSSMWASSVWMMASTHITSRHTDRLDLNTTSSSSRATGWRPSALIGAVVCLCATPRVQLFAITSNGWPHNALWYH